MTTILVVVAMIVGTFSLIIGRIADNVVAAYISIGVAAATFGLLLLIAFPRWLKSRANTPDDRF